VNRKLTIMVSDEVYQGLHRTVGRRRIGKFLEKLARPHVVLQDIEAAYREMASDEEREREAHAWTEGVIGDVAGDPPNAAR
jgi:predicted CopG family antitoxin